jgi:hypothetical protein
MSRLDDDTPLSVRLRDVAGFVRDRLTFYARGNWVYGQRWHDGRMYVVFVIGLHRPAVIHLHNQWYVADPAGETSRYARWLYEAAQRGIRTKAPKVLDTDDMQYLLHRCDVPPPPEIKRLLAVSTEP